MRKYYLVAEKAGNGYFVFVHDNPKGRIVLMEVEAPSFVEAQKKFSFSKIILGEQRSI